MTEPLQKRWKKIMQKQKLKIVLNTKSAFLNFLNRTEYERQHLQKTQIVLSTNVVFSNF